jgi:hypothetical protein
MYTNDWFEYQRAYIEKYIPQPTPDEPFSILEIGAFEGRGTTYYIDNYLHHPSSNITTVDPFSVGDKTCPVEDTTFSRFLGNVAQSKWPAKLSLYKDISSNILPLLKIQNKKYDYISIDGSHLTEDVIYDAVLAFSLLKVNGYILFDDYLQIYPDSKGPQIAIDSFIECFRDRLKVIHKQYHVIVQKIRE